MTYRTMRLDKFSRSIKKKSNPHSKHTHVGFDLSIEMKEMSVNICLLQQQQHKTQGIPSIETV